MKSLDILSTSPHYFCRNWIGATNENSNFDLGVQRVKRCLRSHLVRVCYKRLNLGSYETVLRVQHGNWIVATHWLLDSLCWKKCSCLNINIFIRRCAVPSSCAQPHQSASCFHQPVSCAGIFMHFAIISTAYGTWMELKKPWSLWCSPVHISEKSLKAELVKQKTNIVGKKFFYRLCKSYVDFTSEHVPILMPGFHMIAQSLKKKKISDRRNYSDHMETTPQRSQRQRSLRSNFFYLSDRWKVVFIWSL